MLSMDKLVLAVFVIIQVDISQGLSCTSILQNLDCLPAFTHQPANLVKCYCTNKCPSIETLRQTCQSGQLQTDPCGVCLECAPGVGLHNEELMITRYCQYGERCGGWQNSAGTCAGSLGCLIRYSPGQESEHNKTGTCVTEQGTECKDVKAGVSCRPGQIGVPSEFVFCPAATHGQRTRTTPVTNNPAPVFPLNPPVAPIQSIVSSGTNVVKELIGRR